MLTQRDKIWIGVVVFLLILLAMSLPQYEFCQTPNDHETICDNYHLIPYLIVSLIRVADAHIGFFSLVTSASVALFTFGLVLLGKKAESHFQVVERAYVKMSHYPPGITWIELTAVANAVILIRIKNFGRTPAHVTDVHIESIILKDGEELPPVPQYRLLEGREVTSAFLVTEDEFAHRVVLGIPPNQLHAICDSTERFFLSGYVDYRDRFGGRHRGSFARFFDPDIDAEDQYPSDEAWAKRNNLTIIEQSLYNDDRPRMHGEGNDWN